MEGALVKRLIVDRRGNRVIEAVVDQGGTELRIRARAFVVSADHRVTLGRSGRIEVARTMGVETNLFVVDGSCSPSSVAVHPAPTIAAQALRVAHEGDVLG